MQFWFIMVIIFGTTACQKASSPDLGKQGPSANQKTPSTSIVGSPTSVGPTLNSKTQAPKPLAQKSPYDMGPKTVTCREETMRRASITLTRMKTGHYRFTSSPVATGPKWPRSMESLWCLFNQRDWRVFTCRGGLTLETKFVRSFLGEGYYYIIVSGRSFEAHGTWSSCTQESI